MKKFLKDVEKEAKRAVKLHGEFNSLHEAYAVTLEELDEFWEEVRKKKKDRNKEDIYSELVQIAACCYKTVQYLENE